MSQSALRMTFKELLETSLGSARMGKINTSGVSTLDAGDKLMLADAIENAMKSAWEMPAGKRWVWPWTIATLSGATLTSGAIPWADVDYARWWAVYSTDPRGIASTAWPVPTYWDDLGIHPINNTLASYFVFYIPRTPEFTSTVAAVSTAYAIDDIVYDDGRTGSTGECFRSLTAYTTSSVNATLTADLADSAKWRVQPVYKNFQTYLTLTAFAQWQESAIRDYANAAVSRDNGYADLEQLWKSVRRQARYNPPIHYATGTWR